jgi:hypothetical protein
LRSYSEERRPIFKETAEDFIAARIKKDREMLDRFNPDRDREKFLQFWKTLESDTGSAERYEPNYEGSPVVMGPPNGVCSAHGTHMFKARAGHHLTPQSLSDGHNIFEELGTNFTLLAFGLEDQAIQTFKEAAHSHNIPLKVIRDSYVGGRQAYEQHLILVRPDQYVVWTGDHLSVDPNLVMGRAVGRDPVAGLSGSDLNEPLLAHQ